MPELKSEQEPKSLYDLISEEYTERPILDDWTPEEESNDDSTNIDLKSRKIRRWRKESDARYLKLSRNLSVSIDLTI
ncbi:hypothetical protein TSUD_335220 [Trifolium subterraneum]|uniref:Uncharacterized protein n=1 Tax=Trifolium subterraneum TaxID=3900 RepID=A0A2Z6P5W0_TRISU|nr:hypothetical protein TSUD_335220 [Trifolium subterraneum]